MALALAGVCKDGRFGVSHWSASGHYFVVPLGVFYSGIFFCHGILDIGRVFPLEHAARGLQSAFLLKGSTGLNGVDVGVLVAWTAFGLLVASRNFKWEKSGAGNDLTVARFSKCWHGTRRLDFKSTRPVPFRKTKPNLTHRFAQLRRSQGFGFLGDTQLVSSPTRR